MTTRRNGAGEATSISMSGGQAPYGLFFFLIVVLGLAVWQFGSLTSGPPSFPSDSVTAVFQGNYVAIYNPTNSIVDLFTLSVMRLSGNYSVTKRNLRPRSVTRVPLRRLRNSGGRSYDPEEDGECRVRLQWSVGGEAHELSRYCRDY